KKLDQVGGGGELVAVVGERRTTPHGLLEGGDMVTVVVGDQLGEEGGFGGVGGQCLLDVLVHAVLGAVADQPVQERGDVVSVGELRRGLVGGQCGVHYGPFPAAPCARPVFLD